MKVEDLKRSISDLNLDKIIIDKLINNSILTLEQLWNIKKDELKRLNFKDNEINQIVIRLQLKGIDLNHRKY